MPIFKFISVWDPILKDSRKFARRYLGSFFAILVLASVGLWILHSARQDQVQFAELINVSGRQRMLSQRIDLLMRELVTESLSHERTENKVQLEMALNLFRESHAQLTDPKTRGSLFSKSLTDVYFDSPSNLNQLTEEFIQRVGKFILDSEQDPELALQEINALSAFAKGPLLQRLDEAVRVFQKENELANYKLFLIETFIFSALILFFIVQTFLIFMPVIRSLRQALQTSQKNVQKLGEAEKSLRESQAIFKGIFQRSPLGIYLATVDRRFYQVSPAFCEMLGYTAEELIGKTFAEVSYPEDAERGHIPAQTLLDGKAETVSFEKRYQHKDGRPVWVQLSGGILRDPQGNPLHLLAVVSDITEKKRIDEELRLAKEDAEIGRNFSESITRLIPDVIYISDLRQRKLIYSNRHVGQMFSKAKDAGSVNSAYESGSIDQIAQSVVHPDDMPIMEARKEKFAHLRDGEFVEQTVRMRGDGDQWRWFLTRDTIFRRDSNGEPVEIIGIATDVTEHRQAMDMSKMAEEAALTAARVKSEFLANMSHEIRTPLNGVIGMTDLLSGTKLDESQRQYVNLIQDSGNVLLNVINDILDFSKIEAGKMPLEILDFNLKHMVEGQVNLMSPRAQEKKLAIRAHLDPALATYVKGDPGRIGQILLNLISNAIKFTAEGEIVIRAEKSEDDAGNPAIYFTVTDTGVGISKEVQKMLFTPFTQADGSTARKFGGTGLGLSISKKIVEMMNGRIGLESDEGHGATFWFTVPYQPVKIDTKAANPKKAQAITEDKSAQLVNKRILVAEDNAVNQLLVSTLIRSLGCHVLVVGNGKEVLNALEHSVYDLILMDCQMPEMDGYEATTRIRTHEKKTGQHVPIIALTANALKEDVEKCLNIGMDEHLPKPLRKEQLYAMLVQFLT